MNFTSDERQHEDWWLTGSTNAVRKEARKAVSLETVQKEYENAALAASHLVELDSKILNSIQEAATCKIMGLSVSRLRERVMYLHLRAMRLEKGSRVEQTVGRARQGRKMLEGLWAWVLRGDVDELVAKSSGSLAPTDDVSRQQTCILVQKVIRPEFRPPEGQKKTKRSGSHESVVRAPMKPYRVPEPKKPKTKENKDPKKDVSLDLSPIGSIWSLAEGRSPPVTPGEPRKTKATASHTPITPPLPVPKDGGQLGNERGEGSTPTEPKIRRLEETREKGRARERPSPRQRPAHEVESDRNKRLHKYEQRKWRRHQASEERKREKRDRRFENRDKTAQEKKQPPPEP